MTRALAAALLAVIVVAAGVGPATGETWTTTLQHKLFTSFEEADQLNPRVSALAAYTQRPAEPIEWPSFKCQDPAYGWLYLSWTASSPERARTVLALDRSGGNGGKYDILYVDLNRDNKFGEGERLEGQPTKLHGEQEAIDFGTVFIPIPRPGHDGLHIRFYIPTRPASDNAPQYVLVGYRAWCYMEGEVDIDGEKQIVRLFDGNLNGSFNDQGADLISLGNDRPFALSRLFRYRDKFLTASVADDASSISLSPYPGKTGRLKLDVARDEGSIARVAGVVTTDDGASLQCEGTDGFTLPEGNYRISYLYISCDTGDRVCNTYFRELAASVAGDGETVLKLGKPMHLEVAIGGATAAGGTAVVQYTVRGAAGEVYRDFAWNAKAGTTVEAPKPAVTIRNAGGDVVAQGAMEPG